MFDRKGKYTRMQFELIGYFVNKEVELAMFVKQKKLVAFIIFTFYNSPISAFLRILLNKQLYFLSNITVGITLLNFI